MLAKNSRIFADGTLMGNGEYDIIKISLCTATIPPFGATTVQTEQAINPFQGLWGRAALAAADDVFDICGTVRMFRRCLFLYLGAYTLRSGEVP